MKTLFSILITLHALIHLLGFLIAFGIGEWTAMTQPVPKIAGVFWLLAFILFIVSVILIWSSPNYWWVAGGLAILLSQWLIFLFWQDAKFGTIINAIMLLVALTGLAHFRFERRVRAERKAIMMEQRTPENLATISDLPAPVANWFKATGITDRPIQSAYVSQKIRMKLKPDQAKWYQAWANQYFTLDPPAFHWTVDVTINPLVSMSGRDQFRKGQGEMLIKAFSAIPIVAVSNNAKLNQSSLQRYLAEIVWFPSAARSPYLTWSPIDNRSARATMTYQGVSGSGIFTFNEEGEFIRFSALRYKDVDEGAKPIEWIIEAQETKKLNGINVPVMLSVSWRMDNDIWTWLELEVTGIQYQSVKTLPDH